MANSNLVTFLLVASIIGLACGEWMEKNLTNGIYKMKYEINTECTEVSFQLILDGYAASNVPSSGHSGIWMSLGFGPNEEGANAMKDKDYYSC